MSDPKKYAGEIISNEPSCEDVMIIKIKFEGINEFSHIPGQFVILSFDDVKNEQGSVIKRSYSLPNEPDADHIEICVKQEKTFSKILCESSVGDKINVEGPYGNFNLENYKSKDLMLIAGGTGIAPIISMLRYLLKNDFKNKIDLLYSVRTVKDIIYKEELETCASEHNNFNLHIFITREELAESDYIPGRITEEKLLEISPNQDNEVYICGGNVMVREIIKNLEEIGFNKSQIHREVW